MIFHISGAIFEANVAEGGQAIDGFPDQESSPMLNNTFRNHVGPNATLRIRSSLRWHCPLGMYMPLFLILTANMTRGSCAYNCTEGYFGARHDLTERECSGRACALICRLNSDTSHRHSEFHAFYPCSHSEFHVRSMHETACPVGHYCPLGTSVPKACPPGTYLPATGRLTGYSVRHQLQPSTCCFHYVLLCKLLLLAVLLADGIVVR